MIDWHVLLAIPYGTDLVTLGVPLELLQNGATEYWRSSPNQYIDGFTSFGTHAPKYHGFCWVASQGAADVVLWRKGSASIGNAAPPPSPLLPEPGLVSADEIANYGTKADPEFFERSVYLTHHVSFNGITYHYELVTPRPTDLPIAIQVNRDPRGRVRYGTSEARRLTSA